MSSLPEISGKKSSFQLNHIPKRITLSEVNKLRYVIFFENNYRQILKQYRKFLSDSQLKML